MSAELRFNYDIGSVVTAMKDIKAETLTHLGEVDADAWRVDGSYPIRGYDDGAFYHYDFWDFINGSRTFKELLERRPRGERNVLDLFGSGFFLQSTPIAFNQLIGVRLQNVDQYFVRQAERELSYGGKSTQSFIDLPNRTMIYGDLYRRKTWNEIRTTMQKRKIKSFDLITCRPEGAFNMFRMFEDKPSSGRRLRELAPIFVPLLDRAYRLLSRNDGELFTQLPRFLDEDHYKLVDSHPVDRQVIYALQQLRKTPGITVEYKRDTGWVTEIPYLMHIVKHRNAPESLITQTPGTDGTHTSENPLEFLQELFWR